MNCTLEVINQRSLPQSPSTRRASPVCARPPLAGSPRARGLTSTRAFPGSGRLVRLPPTGAPPRSLRRPFLRVAYPLLANSRLECSPNSGFLTAYHITSCKPRSKTNQRLDKKSRGLPLSGQSARISLPCSPVTATLSPGGSFRRSTVQNLLEIIHFNINHSPPKDFTYV